MAKDFYKDELGKKFNDINLLRIHVPQAVKSLNSTNLYEFESVIKFAKRNFESVE